MAMTSFDFLMRWMEKHPEGVFKQARAAAEKKGYMIYPIMWGRAQVMLGRVKTKPRKKKDTPEDVASDEMSAPKSPKLRKKRTRTTRVEPIPESVWRASARRTDVVSTTQSIPIGADNLDDACALVAAVNIGGTVRLCYDGKNWAVELQR